MLGADDVMEGMQKRVGLSHRDSISRREAFRAPLPDAFVTSASPAVRFTASTMRRFSAMVAGLIAETTTRPSASRIACPSILQGVLAAVRAAFFVPSSVFIPSSFHSSFVLRHSSFVIRHSSCSRRRTAR